MYAVLYPRLWLRMTGFAEIEILDDTLKFSVLMAGCALFSSGAAALPCQASLDVIDQKSCALIIGRI